jgi:four helix bundle protein
MRGCEDAEEHSCGDAMTRGGGEDEERRVAAQGGLTHKDLEVWKLGIDIVEMVYRMTSKFPQGEYGLTNDMRRAAVSVPSNIAEGSARNSSKELVRFLHISLGSLAELETQIVIADRLGYVRDFDDVSELIEKERRKLLNYIKYQKGKQ